MSTTATTMHMMYIFEANALGDNSVQQIHKN